jgi:hypothetical protein
MARGCDLPILAGSLKVVHHKRNHHPRCLPGSVLSADPSAVAGWSSLSAPNRASIAAVFAAVGRPEPGARAAAVPPAVPRPEEVKTARERSTEMRRKSEAKRWGDGETAKEEQRKHREEVQRKWRNKRPAEQIEKDREERRKREEEKAEMVRASIFKATDDDRSETDWKADAAEQASELRAKMFPFIKAGDAVYTGGAAVYRAEVDEVGKVLHLGTSETTRALRAPNTVIKTVDRDGGLLLEHLT